MKKMNFTPADDLVDEVFGKRGTSEREAMESRLKKEVDAYLEFEGKQEKPIVTAFDARRAR